MGCIFCQIAEKKIPADIVYEDEHIVAFNDINPQAPRHILIIPRKHINTMLDIRPEDSQIIAHIFSKIPLLAGMIGGNEGFRLVGNCKESAGQSVFHIHFHLMAGRNFGWPPG